MKEKKLLIYLHTITLLFFISSAFGYPTLKKSEPTFYSNILYYLAFPTALFTPHKPLEKVIYKTQTQYNDIEVIDNELNERKMVFLPENGVQSIIDKNNPNKLVSDYAILTFNQIDNFIKNPKRALFIGMGGAVMPRHFADKYPNCSIEIIEIDECIPSIAEHFFYFKESEKIKVIIDDGYDYVNKSQKKYDIIFMDVYNSEDIPEKFLNTDFFTSTKNLLNQNGILTVNLANFNQLNTDSNLTLIESIYKTTLYFITEDNTNYVTFSIKEK